MSWTPCQRPCSHTACIETHETARTDCAICGAPIGYDTDYVDGPNPPLEEGDLAHMACAAATEPPALPEEPRLAL